MRPTSLVQIPQTSNAADRKSLTPTTKIVQPVNLHPVKTIDKPNTNFTGGNIISAGKGKPTMSTIKPGSSVFQISPQFMMTKGKVIQLPNNSQIITSSSETGTSLVTTDQQPRNQLKFIQSGTISQQQILGAKFLNVAGLTGRTVRTTTGVK